MEKNPGSRYVSAESFAADLARVQRGEPVSARPATLPERALAWQRRNRASARAMAAAAAALLLSLGWTMWRARRADFEALEAARLGALGESMEAALRMEYLSPPHDLRPALARVRAQVEALRPQAARGGGPASFALGKGLEMLGDGEGARAAFEQAWAKGFRIPRVAEELGHALGEQYRRARQRAFETLEPPAREQRLAVLRTELRDPAIQYLALADSGSWRTAFLKASIALLEGDYATARARAAEVLATEPGRYEALSLQAQTHLEQANQLASDGRLDPALAEADRAAQLLTAAVSWGRWRESGRWRGWIQGPRQSRRATSWARPPGSGATSSPKCWSLRSRSSRRGGKPAEAAIRCRSWIELGGSSGTCRADVQRKPTPGSASRTRARCARSG
jgi:hypothetical protein